MKNKDKILKILALVGLVLLTFFIMVYFTPEKLRALISSYGEKGPIIYIFLWAILPIGFFPVPVLALAGGIGFGFVNGTIYTLIGAMLNIGLMFLSSRFIAKEMVRKFALKKFPKIEKLLAMESKKLYLTLFISRLIPLIPYNIINYGFGLTDISFIKYMIISVVGIIPGTLVFLNIGNQTMDIKSSGFAISLILMLALILLSSFFAKKIKEKEDDNSSNTDL